MRLVLLIRLGLWRRPNLVGLEVLDRKFGIVNVRKISPAFQRIVLLDSLENSQQYLRLSLSLCVDNSFRHISIGL